MLPGASVTYNGEEIGMEDSCVVYNQNPNLPGRRCNTGETSNSDSRFRTPMQWDDTKNGGFSENDNPWLPIGDKYREVNVKIQEGKAGSHLEIYKTLQKFRHSHKAMKSSVNGFKLVALSENAFAFTREMSRRADESVLVLINFGGNEEIVKIQEKITGLPDFIRVKIVASENSKFVENQEVEIVGEMKLSPFESIVAVYNNSNAIKFSKILVLLWILVKLI